MIFFFLHDALRALRAILGNNKICQKITPKKIKICQKIFEKNPKMQKTAETAWLAWEWKIRTT